MSDLVGNPEDRFSRVAAQMTSIQKRELSELFDMERKKRAVQAFKAGTFRKLAHAIYRDFFHT